MMRTANPALSAKSFAGIASERGENRMTLEGTVNKTGILLLLLCVTATFTWRAAMNGQAVQLWLWVGLGGGLVFGLITAFAKTWAGFTAPLYALFEGLFLGAVSAFFEMRFPGIVIQAVALTFGTLFALLLAYKSGLIRATENFKLGVAAATGGIFLIYLVGFVMSFFGTRIPMIHESGLVGIGFSLFVVVIAALNLVLDFDFIEAGAEHGAPKYMEWYGAFGLVVTLVWLYLEMLRLLTKLNSRD
jgi:uncharacterized YccA/Bax inhibitor family protein